jgi:NAD(P)-dependent dehydrogenase (short-subunit alcohol dehydrogenase family)
MPGKNTYISKEEIVMVDLSRFSLEGKVAVVTGGSKGIGRMTAIGFAKAGADVVIASRKMEELEKVAEEIEKAGQKALPVAAHVGRMQDIHRIVEMTMDRFGKIDVLVNNAATSPAYTTILDAEERLWDTIMNLNLKGVYFLVQATAKVMKQAGGGSIVNVSSIDSIKPQDQVGIYSISKAGLNMLTKSAALELAPYNIRVNAIAPGAVRTRLLESLFYNLSPAEREEQIAKLGESAPLARVGVPDDMVGALIYLASDASAYTTGEVIVVDGGALLAH